MALDGITIHELVYEFKETLNGGRLFKIAQPEKDELLLTIKKEKEQFKLLLSANPSLPLAYITEESKQSPLTAPNFCMVLRKHLNNAKIIDIYQPGLERIINFKIQHYNEMGDLCEKTLIIELMGKYSNIILTDENDTVIDSIKHISANISSIREVLPGRKYFIPDKASKLNPLEVSAQEFKNALLNCPESMSVKKGIYSCFTGISPVIAENLCYLCNMDSDSPLGSLKESDINLLFNNFSDIMDCVRNNKYHPHIIYEQSEGRKIPKEFSPVFLKLYQDYSDSVSYYDSMSQVIFLYYRKKAASTRMHQKSSDLRKIIQNLLEKDYKKYDLQINQMKDTEKKEKYRIYGELLTTYGYNIAPDAESIEVENYYDHNKLVTIPLKPDFTPLENAQIYFEKYNKLKRTYEALKSITICTKDEITHLESVLTSLDLATDENDLKQIKEELIQSGYIKKKVKDKKISVKSSPLHFISSDGFHMYVGKNNLQNEDLTFNFANGGDWWFHAKQFPGSHVIVKTQGNSLPDRTFEEAASLAAYFSKGKDQDKVLVDYTMRKNVKKVPGSKPGFVIYNTNYSLAIAPDISNISQV